MFECDGGIAGINTVYKYLWVITVTECRVKNGPTQLWVVLTWKDSNYELTCLACYNMIQEIMKMHLEYVQQLILFGAHKTH